ncbi:MAG: NF038122 family metalloprotease [Pirellulales bacterium]
MNLEKLENRVLLALSPQLVSIQPNDGELLNLDGGANLREVAPRDLNLRFDDGQILNPDTLDGVRILRSGFDGEFANDSILVTPGFIGLGDVPNEIVIRFAETLPDDEYRIEIIGAGAMALENTEGDAFNNGQNLSVPLTLDLGAQVIAVVPQPISRGAGGDLTQARNQIVVYFNNDDLNHSSAENPAFYQLIFTGHTSEYSDTFDSVHNTDDRVYLPTSIEYQTASERTDVVNATGGRAVLTFAHPLDQLPDRDANPLAPGARTYRLRIGTSEVVATSGANPGLVRPMVPEQFNISSDPGSSFDTAQELDVLGDVGKIISQDIFTNDFPLNYPGSNDEPGHRNIATYIQEHLAAADPLPGVTVQAYNFQSLYGTDPQGNPLFNLITDVQKQRAREIFELYSNYLGIRFIETANQGFTIVTGDLRALNPTVPTGPGGVIGLAGAGVAIMDNAESWSNDFGESWFRTAMHEIGHLLGSGHTYEQPPLTIQGDEADLIFTTPAEGVYPGDHDIVHGQHLHRPEGNDIDMYRFEVQALGLFSAETTAERQTISGLLDTHLTLYRQTPEGERVLIARNDDYFSEDSFLEMTLQPGVYFVGVSASGNGSYDPTIENTGSGGRSEGVYDLRLNFRPEVSASIVDATGTALDGDSDGVPGGVFNFWFRSAAPRGSQAPGSPSTIFVDKSAAPGGDGSLAAPFNRISSANLNDPNTAMGTARAGDVVRIVGNGGADGNVNTLGDNLAYEIGFGGASNQALSDGSTLEVRQGVTVMIDAGSVFKLRRALVGVGSSAPEVNRSGSALQVLGTPETNVIFTSYNDQSIGVDTNPLVTSPAQGDWGGLLFRHDHDRSAGRFDYERQGVFIDTVNHADLRYGGGNVVINSVEQVVTPIQMFTARPTVFYNHIQFSADAAMSADPNSFEETNFHAPLYQSVVYTSDYDRIGPDIHGNRIGNNNSINGLFVRIATPSGNQLRRMTVSGRWDDTDIVHVVAENLQIAGTPGGPILVTDPVTGATSLNARLDASLVIDPGMVVKLDASRINATIGAQLIAEGVDGQEIIFTSVLDDRYGAGGVFDTTGNTDQRDPDRGNWGGLFFSPGSSASIDHALFAFGGGITTIEGNFAGFNVIEIHQAEARITDSVFEFNAYGQGFQTPANRVGRGNNAPGTIFILGAQPVIANNVIRDNDGPAITSNVNALNHRLLPDYGRSTGDIELIESFGDNQGPLIRNNLIRNSDLNGMVVRGGTLTTQGVWDDTDIVHIVFETIVVPDFHSYGGLRLESSATQSLVVKLWADELDETAGFTATGRPLDIADRIGGAVQIVGKPGFPVVLTSLSDNTVGAGFDPQGRTLTDTNNEQLPDRTAPPRTFKIDYNLSPQVAANPDTVWALQRAADIWEALLEDPITVTLDVDFGAAGAGGGIATPIQTTLGYDAVRQLMIADAGPHESVVSQIPTFSQLNVSLPVDLLNPYLLQSSMMLNRANAKALGVPAASLPQTPSVFDPNEFLDGTLTIDPALNAPAVDIFVLALSLVGKAIGFTSGVDGVDAGNRNVSLSPMDLYRLEPGAGNDDFTNSPRAMDPTLTHVFYDGGHFKPLGIELFGLEQGDIPLATGVNNGDGSEASNWKNRDLINGVNLGAMHQTVFSRLTSNDKRAFDLIGFDVVGGGLPGDWRGVLIDEYGGDRNIEVITEREAPDLVAPGNNATPNTAHYIGELAPHEKAGDDTLRLGYNIHGYLNAPTDVDVYSFRADAGTEVWFDLDNTTTALDAVIELIDANGNVLARSVSSHEEAEATEFLEDTDALFGPARVLQKSEFYTGDHWTINPHDPGMRMLLPGPAGTTNTYHVRIRSNSADIDDPSSPGLTSGVYQLQMRLREIEEVPGNSIKAADIKYAINGVEILGQPKHSPLLGEIGEDGTVNDQFIDAQRITNPLQSDRGATSVAGTLTTGDVDWFEFDLEYDSIYSIPGFNDDLFAALQFDIDYADGFANADTSLSVYRAIIDANGDVTGAELVLIGRQSNHADDLAAPNQGSDVDDLTRGSNGVFDASIGSISLPVGRYFVAVHSDSLMPQELDQYYVINPANHLVRLEPVDSLIRIAEDHGTTAVGGVIPGIPGVVGVSTFAPPILPGLFQSIQRMDGENIVAGLADRHAVPWHLGDVTLFISTPGNNETDILAINPFTGAPMGESGTVGRQLSDIAMRDNGNLYAFTLDLQRQGGPSDALSGNFLEINPNNANSTQLGDDGIQTFQPAPIQDPMNPMLTPEPADVGIQFHATTFAEIGNTTRLFAVGNRGDDSPFDEEPRLGPPRFTDNIMYEFAPDNGDAIPNDPIRDGEAVVASETWTDVIERGRLHTGVDPDFDPMFNIWQIDTVIRAIEATEYNALGSLIAELLDGSQFIVDVDGEQTVFEFERGPELSLDWALGTQFSPGDFTQDGEFFVLTGPEGDVRFEIESGVTLEVTDGGSAFVDGQTFEITDYRGTTKTFEYDSDGSLVNSSHVAVPFSSFNTQQAIAQQTADAISGGGFAVQAVAVFDRVSLIGESEVTLGPDFDGITLQGDIGIDDGVDDNFAIFVEESSTPAEVREAIRQAVTSQGDFMVSVDGERVNFADAEDADFSSVPLFDVVMTSAAGVSSGATPIFINAADTAEQVAGKIQAALTDAEIAATQVGKTVTLVNGLDETIVFVRGDLDMGDPEEPVPPTGPALTPEGTTALLVGGTPPSGVITGITQLGGVIYAVSDNGGLYTISNPRGSATATYVGSAIDLVGIPFTGLTAGPTGAEAGLTGASLYDNILFATTSTGQLVAFDTTGELQPLFYDGQSMINIGASAHGLAFSTLQANMWKTTGQRGGTAEEHQGHGIEIPVTVTRDETAGGGTSYYFGLVDIDVPDRHYDFPGGAHGTLISADFSLAGYSDADRPVLYFTYWAETEEKESDTPGNDPLMRDAFRVFVSDNSETAGVDLLGQPLQGQWQLLGTNNSLRGVEDVDEFDDPFNLPIRNNEDNFGPIQEVFDHPEAFPGGQWRQVRIPLDDWAGSDSLRLRFDFSTAASMDLGGILTTGSELRGVAAPRLRDGDVFTVDSQTFEFEMGFSLVAPNAGNVSDGETFTINNGTSLPVTFEFDSDGSVDADPDNFNVPIAITGNESGAALAVLMEQAIREQRLADSFVLTAPFGFQVTQTLSGENFTISDGVNPPVTYSLGFGVGGVQIPVAVDDSDLVVAQAIADAINNSGQDVVATVEGNLVRIDGAIRITQSLGTGGIGSTVEPLIDIMDLGIQRHENRLNLPGAVRITQSTGAGVALRGAPGTSSQGFFGEAQPVHVNLGMSANDVAKAVSEALAAEFAGGATSAFKRNGDTVYVVGHSVTNQGPLGLANVLPGDTFGGFGQFDDDTGLFAGLTNQFEGVYIDDLIIGFAERGEMVTHREVTDSAFATSFIANPATPDNQITLGEYQLELRPSAEYGVPTLFDEIPFQRLIRSVDTNNRLSRSISMDVPSPAQLAAGETFTLGDGIDRRTFQFVDLSVGETAAPGNIAIPYRSADLLLGGTVFQPATSAEALAQSIVQIINTPAVQHVLGITAAAIPTLNRIELHGESVIVYAESASSSSDLLEGLGQTTNDTVATAVETGIMPGGPQSYFATGIIGDNPNFLSPAQDVDLVTLNLAAGDRITVDIDAGINGSFLDSMLRLFRLDALGNPIPLTVSDDVPAPGEPFTLDSYIDLVVAQGGTYVVGVSSFNNRFYDPTLAGSGFGGSIGEYTVEILVNGAPSVGSSLAQNVLRVRNDDIGDPSRVREQGQVIVQQTRVLNSQHVGILVDAAPRDALTEAPHLGPIRQLVQANMQRLAPGVTIKNNVIAGSGDVGIALSGDENPTDMQLASVPFGRIVNNTIYGRNGTLELESLRPDTGIRVGQNASPTLLNNVVTNTRTGVLVDPTSQSTVKGGNLFQGNVQNSNVGLGDFPIVLPNSSPLFVNGAEGNFHLLQGSVAIDSAINSLQDRAVMVSVREPLGYDASPIFAPDRDLTGQFRVDDPNVGPPVGIGDKDRGALDRSDFQGPSALLLTPRDNGGTDMNPAETAVQLAGAVITRFSLQLVDGSQIEGQFDGVGVDDTTVTSARVTITRDGVTLVEGTDYRFDYDSTNNIVQLTPLAGLWENGSTYVITLNNSAGSGIADASNNVLLPNQTDGQTRFTIELTRGLDYGDAPSPYPTLTSNNGARHAVTPELLLGSTVDGEENGQPSPSADGDGPDDDGVEFGTIEVNSSASATIATVGDGFVDAWIDFNQDGDWNDPGEQIAASFAVEDEDDNIIAFSVPRFAQLGNTFARVRLSSTGGLTPTGSAPDGEVEDYQVTVGGNPWHNSVLPNDVDGNGFIIPRDVLLIISELNNPVYRDVVTGALPIPVPGDPASADPPVPFLDVTNDGFVAPNDALSIINFLNNLAAFGGRSAASQPASGLLVAADVPDAAESLAAEAGLADAVLQEPLAAPVSGRHAADVAGFASQPVMTDDESWSSVSFREEVSMSLETSLTASEDRLYGTPGDASAWDEAFSEDDPRAADEDSEDGILEEVLAARSESLLAEAIFGDWNDDLDG